MENGVEGKLTNSARKKKNLDREKRTIAPLDF